MIAGTTFCLPLNLQPKLDLPWIVGRRGLARVGEQLIHVGYVEFVRDIENVHRSFKAQTFAQRKLAPDA